jgi:hypothetical protein
MTIVFFVNGLARIKHTSAVMPLVTIITLIAAWFVLCVPLTFIGSYAGYRTRVGDFRPKLSESMYIGIGFCSL